MGVPLRTIGQILPELQRDYPDVTVTKIRYLESEGLVSPVRTDTGYRKYSTTDVDRLRYILRLQRDNYLPLKVIREHLEQMDAGENPAPPVPAAPTAQPTTKSAPVRRVIRMTRKELLRRSGLRESVLVELERQRLVVPRHGTVHFGQEALIVATAAKKLSSYGMDIRHLRAIKQAAEREAGLIEQAVAPYPQQSPSGREATRDVANLVVRAHAALVHSILDQR
ncbi:MAG: hypothetical protein CR980_01150 [Propionibacteriales bacterium]|nr:MAG: hypothetical protein CR980_01150 [Propionibacteriales bacterium]